ncbi:MAG: hypothetical protein IJU20_05170, partial [Clostridia bacterium]|nr:hypothetical protein [Clostridia bacterium]
RVEIFCAAKNTTRSLIDSAGYASNSTELSQGIPWRKKPFTYSILTPTGPFENLTFSARNVNME